MGVSFTLSPVTHTADVDVKSASIKLQPFVLEIGRVRRIAPISITHRKPSTRICGGENFIFISINFKKYPAN